jgi:hypothetical protein
MRALTTALLALFAGCGVDTLSHVACNTDPACVARVGALRGGDASVADLPLCCNHVCVIPAGGCDTYLRYLAEDESGEIEVGDCVSAAACGIVLPDLSTEKPTSDLRARGDLGERG